YQLLNVLSSEECRRLVALGESLGYLGDAAVSLPREIRHNDNVVWVTDGATDGIIWRRVAHLAERDLAVFAGKRPLGLNARFRFYRYGPGDYFKPHSDGSWPGSRVVDGRLVANAYPDRYSLMTFLIFLNDGFEGGATRFRVPDGDFYGAARRAERYREVDVRTPLGAVLCFPHGTHPLHCIHSSEPITRGVKYIIRTDMLFEL
ncbi:MAG: 2OG-Fe(II) oxygenase, partial [Bacteroidales bacterium]|nr:2OG-Fe(II) oxygenase [Bacteroidales bacterium]